METSQELDRYIGSYYTQELWFIKYKGNILYPCSGVRGYRTKAVAITNMVDTILDMVRHHTFSHFYANEEKIVTVKRLLDIPEEDMNRVLDKNQSDNTNIIRLAKVRKYIKDTYIKKLMDNNILEIVKL